jgi:hydroxymethylglutaryl-CoA reductase (NADPH)
VARQFKQAEAPKINGLPGKWKSGTLCKINLWFCIRAGLRISTYSAIVSGEFAKAHERRNKPKNWLTRSELTPKFLPPIYPKTKPKFMK